MICQEKRIALAASAMLIFSASPAIAKEDWVPLFNGRNLDGWTPKIAYHPVGENFKDTFTVHDGAIRVSYSGYNGFDHQFGHLFYKLPFSSYRLRLKYRVLPEFSAGAPKYARSNSGVMFHAQSPNSMAINQWFPVSVEFQILGKNDDAPSPTGSVCTPGTNVSIGGARIPGHCATSAGPIVPNGRWTDLELVVAPDGQITHKINGQIVLTYSNVEYDLLDLTAEPLVANQNDKLELKSGYIALQSEGNAVEFKDIEILNLAP